MRVKKYDLGSAPNVAYQPTRFPIWQFSQLMFLGGPDIYGAMRAWNELAINNPKLKEEFDRQGIKFLSSLCYPSMIISDRPLAEVENFRGMKFRALGPMARWVISLGATAIPVITYEVSEALSKKIIDAVVGCFHVLCSSKAHNYCKFLTVTPVANLLTFDTWINLDTWQKFPPDIKRIYEEGWREYYPKAVIKYYDAENAVMLKDLKDAGVKIINLSPDQYTKWKKSAGFLADRYFREMKKMGVDGRKIINEYEEFYKKHERK